MSLVCKIKNENSKIVIESGILSEIPSFCDDRLSEKKCNNFYNELLSDTSDSNNIICCPYGFNCIKKNEKIYTCLLVKDEFINHKIKQKKGDNQKVFTEEEIIKIIEYDNNLDNLKIENENFNINISNLLHDLNKSNQMIQDYSITLKATTKHGTPDFFKLESIDKLSNFINSRIELYGYIQNPERIIFGTERKTDVYKVWDIYRNIFIDIASRKNIRINIKKMDENLNELDLKETIINTMSNLKRSSEILAFLLLDNAVKYSNEKTNIDICFIDSNDENFCVKVSSFCNTMSDEPSSLFVRGYRGKENEYGKSSGSGLGLAIAKEISSINNIDISIEIKHIDKNIDNFVVNLNYKKT